MGMRTYAVRVVGLILTLDEYADLLENNLEFVREILDDKEIEKEDITDITELFEMAYDIGFSTYSQIEGEILTLDETDSRQYLDYDDVFVLDLEKAELFDGYKDKEEIYNEIKRNLQRIGITNVSMEFIKEKTGWLSGTYFG